MRNKNLLDRNKKTSQNKENFSSQKKLLFGIILILIPLILFSLIELSLRLIHYGDNYKLFVETKSYGKEYKICNPEYGKKYFFKFKYTTPQNDRFLKKKPENSFRIFVIGSSDVWGFPYNSGIMFTRILQQRLQESFPNKNIEMVNTAITAINSYTFIDKIDEILNEKPDALLIYAGHNEFYGAMGIASKEGLGQIRWLKLLHLRLLEFKTYQMIRNFIAKLQSIGKPPMSEFENETATLMQRIVSNKNIEYKSEKYNMACKQYRQNMDAVVKKAKQRNVPVFISNLVGIVKELKPFGSSKTDLYPAAFDVYNKAVEYEQQGDYAKAKENYYYAKDLDCIRFRASEEINDIIREIARKNGTYLVDMKSYFQAHSPHELIGHNLLTEHVHPNIDGYFLMADAFYNALIGSNLIGKPDPANYKPSSYYRNNWGYTQLDSVFVALRIKQLTGGWPFKSDTIINQFIHQFKPKNIIDSLAYQDLRFDDVTEITTHKKLANYYVQRNEFEKAAQEYFALVKIDPYNNQDLIETGSLFFKAKNYDKALEVFLASLKINPELPVLEKTGELYCLKSQFQEAIPYLEKVRTQNPDFSKAENLKLLYQAYKATSQTEKAESFSSELAKLKGSDENKEQKIIYSSSKVKELVDEALKLLKSGKTDEALTILYKANKIEESGITNRLIGEVLLSRNDQNALKYLKKAYQEYNSDPQYLNTLCYACIHFNELKFADKILIELKQLAPNNPNLKKYEDMIRQKRN
jgi:tetratricopeptide (TPR) repeat protein